MNTNIIQAVLTYLIWLLGISIVCLGKRNIVISKTISSILVLISHYISIILEVSYLNTLGPRMFR